MYIVYEEHIEQLEEENADLKQEVLILRQRLQYYKEVTEEDETL
jgi:cell division septum initiation protein DivIVA